MSDSVIPEVNGDFGVHSQGDGPSRINQDEGNRQKNDDGNRIDGGDSCLNLNLNFNSDSLSPRVVGKLRDYHSEASGALIAVNANREVCAEELIVGRVEGELERAHSFAEETEGVEQRTPLIAEEIEGVEQRSMNMNNDAISQASDTRTKTAQLSDNDYSTEGVVDGFGVGLNESMARHTQTESDDSVPPGFEGYAVPKGIAGMKGKGKSRYANPEESSRITRSQLRKARMKETGRNNTGRDNTGTSSNRWGRQSIETTESMKKQAEEALRVGELLGVKVISHRANAVKRITDSLKANRATRSARV